MMSRRVLGATLAFIAGGTTFSRAAPWSELKSDLPDDPRLHQGSLANGLRYVILPNAEPKNRVSLRLVVAVGSLHENDDERGLAHFVEHMAFRGTRQYPAGSLIQSLQRLGVGLGPDNTAFTTFDHTIYHLELPDTKPATLRAGLRALHEYADSVTFDAALIERERGVVLSEWATRETPQSRAANENMRFLWPEARASRRIVIGEPAQIRTFTRQQFVAFYDAWYRPERMALIVVGDLDPATAEQEIRQGFRDLAGRGEPRPEPTDMVAQSASKPNVGVYTDPGLQGASIALEHPVRQGALPTHHERVLALHEAMAMAMLQQRLQRIAHAPDTALVGPAAMIAPGTRDWQTLVLTAAGEIIDWRRAAAELEHEHRRAYQYGFTASEIRAVRASFATAYNESVLMAPSRPSPALALQLVTMLLYGGGFTTPEALQRDLESDLAAATLPACLTAFRTAWTAHAPSVFVFGNPALKITAQEVAQVLNQSRDAEITPPKETVAPEFAYRDFGPPGRLIKDEPVTDLDVRLAEYANGVRLNFKATNFSADMVEIRVRLGEGKLSQLRSWPGVDLLANVAFTAGGVGRHTTLELNEILAGHAMSLSFHVDVSACEFVVECARRDLLLACQIVTAFISEPAFRPDGMRDARAAFGGMYNALAASPSGPISMRALREVFDNDSRFAIPEYDELCARNLGELRSWLGPQLESGPIEMSVVGDVRWEDAAAAVASTLGALPHRGPAAGLGLVMHREPVRPRYQVYATNPNLKQIAVAWYWPVGDVTDYHEERRCYLLANILSERLRVKLRDELGAAYTPTGAFVRNQGMGGADYFVLSAELQPSHAMRAFEILQREVAELHQHGPSADEFARAKQPFEHSWNADLRTNAYWGGRVLARAQEEPRSLAAARDRTADVAAITRKEIAALAGKYLDPAQAHRFAALPMPASAPASAASAAPASKPNGYGLTGVAAFTGPDAVPQPIFKTNPAYPLNLRKTVGDVLVDFVVDTAGNVQNAYAARQTNEDFGKAAVDCVRQWKFNPGLKDGKPVMTHMQVPIQFRPDR